MIMISYTKISIEPFYQSPYTQAILTKSTRMYLSQSTLTLLYNPIRTVCLCPSITVILKVVVCTPYVESGLYIRNIFP